MCKKLCLVLMVLVACIGAQAAIQQTAAGGEWSQGSTWIGGVVPTTGDAYIIASNAAVTVATPGNTCAAVYVGGLTTGGADVDTLNVQAGGTLTTSGNVFLSLYAPYAGTLKITGGTLNAGAYFGAQANVGTFIQTAGTFNVPGIYFGFTGESDYTAYVSGGTINCAGELSVGRYWSNVLGAQPMGDWQQSGGLTKATGNLVIGADGGIGSVELSGNTRMNVAGLTWGGNPWGIKGPDGNFLVGSESMTIDDGAILTLTAAKDTSQLDSLIASGGITSEDSLHTWFDANGAHVAVTGVTPEPATMILLSLGGFALLRKKK